MQHISSNLYRLGDFTMDFGSGDLCRDGQVIRLKPQPCRVLRLLVERPGETVLREEIQREVWGGDTFVDFERGLNSCIKQIRAAFGDDPDAPRFIETITRRGYRFIAPVAAPGAVNGAPSDATIDSAHGVNEAPAVLNGHSPVETVTETAAPAASVRSAKPHPIPWIRRTMQWSAVVLLLAVTTLALVTLGSRRSHTAGDPARVRMAVLPFRNLSGDAAQDFLGDGLSEELITQLGALAPQRLGVIARTSSAQYRQTSRSAAQIGSELQVGYVLEGSVRREGEKLHVTAQLIQTSDQTQLWAAAYDRDSGDTLSIEQDLAQRVARSLALQLLPARDNMIVAPFTRNAEAHDAYLRGRYEMNRMTLEGFIRARSYFEQAVHSDPGFALAHAALADTYSLEPWWGGMTPREAFPKARAAVERALQIDDGLAEAHTSLGFIRLYYDWDLAGAEQEFERAVRLQPGLALAHYWYAGMLSAAGRHDDAMAAMRRAQELDPLSPMINADAGWYYLYARRYDEAVRQCRRALEIDPSFLFAQTCVIDAHRLQGRYDEAANDAKELIRMRAAQQGRAIAPLTGSGREALRDFDTRRLATLQKAPARLYISPYALALSHIALDQKDAAFADLERAHQQRDTFIVQLDVDPRLDGIRNDPRFGELKKTIGK